MDDEDGKGRNFITTSVGKGMLVTMLVCHITGYLSARCMVGNKVLGHALCRLSPLHWSSLKSDPAWSGHIKASLAIIMAARRVGYCVTNGVTSWGALHWTYTGCLI